VDDSIMPETVSRDARDRLVRLAYRFAWNRDDAEDAVQEALTVYEKKRHQLRDPGRWWSWLQRIVVQQCRLLGRRASSRRSHELRTARSDQTAAHEEAPVEAAEAKTLLRALLSDLPDRQREVVVLRHLEGLEVCQIAAILEISESTVRVQARNGRETLKRLMLLRYPQWAARWSEAAETRQP